MTAMYHKVDSARITELRKIADTLTTNDLLALTMMWGLRNVQGMNIDTVTRGDVDPDELDQTHDGMIVMAADMTCDIVTPEGLRAVARANELGDYSVGFVKKIVVVRKSV